MSGCTWTPINNAAQQTSARDTSEGHPHKMFCELHRKPAIETDTQRNGVRFGPHSKAARRCLYATCRPSHHRSEKGRPACSANSGSRANARRAASISIAAVRPLPQADMLLYICAFWTRTHTCVELGNVRDLWSSRFAAYL